MDTRLVLQCEKDMELKHQLRIQGLAALTLSQKLHASTGANKPPYWTYLC